jgi:FkbM family methyltransferase
MIRTIAERLSRGIVLKRRLPADVGGMALMVSPDASLRYWKFGLQHADPMLLNAAKFLVRPADVVWDVGANVGMFSFASAGLAGAEGKVLAIEPDPWLSQLLRESSRLRENAGHSVEILSVALSEHTGLADLNIANRGRAANFLSGVRPSNQTGGVRDCVKVVCLTLDWLLENFQRPSVVKIDVEGAEAAVLRGARKLLRDVRPKFLCEVAEDNRDAVTSIFLAAGYQLFDAEKPSRGSTPLARCAFNTIALPAGRESTAR